MSCTPNFALRSFAKYLQILELYGPHPLTFLEISVTVLLQLWTATYLCNASRLKILTVGSFLAIHELSHNLCIPKVSLGAPQFPGHTKAHVVTNVVAKSIWLFFQLFFYALRPLFLRPNTPCLWEFTNLIIQLALDASLVYFCGWKSLAYIILQPYVFHPEQETYSYYGPHNLMTWSVGYGNDFPRIPGSRLRRVKEIAPEYYDVMYAYKSWSQVIYMYIMDCTVGPFSRMKGKASQGSSNKKEERGFFCKKA